MDHKQHAKQSTDLRVNINICSDRTNKLEGRKSSMKLMQETEESLSKTDLKLSTRKVTAISGRAGQR